MSRKLLRFRGVFVQIKPCARGARVLPSANRLKDEANPCVPMWSETRIRTGSLIRLFPQPEVGSADCFSSYRSREAKLFRLGAE